MNRIYSNGLSGDFVISLFKHLLKPSTQLYLAAPYFTKADLVLDAIKQGKTVQLLVGLNAITSPVSLRKCHDIPGLSVRYFTTRFHAKIYIFDDTAILGSSNLTDGGLISNREAVICLDRPDDHVSVEELRALFSELWDSGQVLTTEKLKEFANAHKASKRRTSDSDTEIEKAVGRAEPPNINVESRTKTRERIFLEQLRQKVYEQYRPAFNEVNAILEEHNFRRPELAEIGQANETNRFLNWLRLTYVIGDEAWQSAPLRSPEIRNVEIMRFGKGWVEREESKVSDDFVDRLNIVAEIFGTADSIEAASKEGLTTGLMAIHAFVDQFRFVKGGEDKLPSEFWSGNRQNVARVKETLKHLLHGSGDFIPRLHDILYDPTMKVYRFGQFCALELYGTVKPQECPPMNGRIAKALRYLGFDVRGV